MSTSVIKLLLGPILLGVSLNTFLYGVCVMQFVNYYTSQRRLEDSLSTRYLVAWELLVDTVHSITAIYFLWQYMVDNFLNVAFLETVPWPLAAVPGLTAVSAGPIQMFLVYRVYSLSNSRGTSAALVLLTLATAALGIVTSVYTFRAETFTGKYIDEVRPVADAWLGLSVANDLAITVALVFCLNASRTGLPRTNTVITRLIRSAIESAAAATLFAIMIAVTFTRFPLTGLHLLFSVPMGRIYTTTLMSTLNRRESLREDLHRTRDLDQELPVGALSFEPG
ncbi:hypothetical protein DFH06DRAFT_1320690 [Mycena polygramma]|nr:hypothetical protein DFH06DRAFT_1320690 [Mycena polygramma]